MSGSSPQRLPFRNSDVVAMVLIALGVVVTGGWMLGRPLTFTVGLDDIGMTLNAAASFIVAGLALMIGPPRTRLALAVLLAIPSVLTLCEHIFKVDFGIDQLLGQSWILHAAPNQGRMAPQVAAAFALASLALIQLTRPQHSRLHWIAPLATSAVFLIALVSFFGRLLRLDIIYDWHYATRIAPHTAAGLLLLSLGLAQIAYRRSFTKADDVSNDSRRILAVSTAAMLAITITCAAVCFAVVVRHSHDLQQSTLARELHNQVELISIEIASQRQESERIVSSQSLAQIIARSSPQVSLAELRQGLQSWAEHRLPLSRGLQALEVMDANGQLLLQSGSFGPPSGTVVRLDDQARIEIGNDARIVIERPTPTGAAAAVPSGSNSRCRASTPPCCPTARPVNSTRASVRHSVLTRCNVCDWRPRPWRLCPLHGTRRAAPAR